METLETQSRFGEGRTADLEAFAKRTSIGDMIERYAELRKAGETDMGAMCAPGVLTERGCGRLTMKRYMEKAAAGEVPYDEIFGHIRVAEHSFMMANAPEALDNLKRSNPDRYLNRTFPKQSRASRKEQQSAKFRHFGAELIAEFYGLVMERAGSMGFEEDVLDALDSLIIGTAEEFSDRLEYG
jgi:hypothetical protein